MSEKWFMTDAEVANVLGIPTTEFRGRIKVLEGMGFPPRDSQFGNRRYVPAIRSWLDSRYRLVASSEQGHLARYEERR